MTILIATADILDKSSRYMLFGVKTLMRERVALIKKRRCPTVGVASWPRCGYRVCDDSEERTTPPDEGHVPLLYRRSEVMLSIKWSSGSRREKQPNAPEAVIYRVMYEQECQVSSKEALKPRTLLYQHGPWFCRCCSLFGQRGK